MSNENSKPNIIIMGSYGMGKFLAEFFQQAFGVLVFFFYEVVIGLDVGLGALGFIIYSLYNALNDPLIGYLTEKKKTRLSERFGRRFPWIFIGSLLYITSFLFIFIVPSQIQSNQFLILLWMIISTCVYDTFYSLWDVSYQSLFPDKFRDSSARNATAGIATVVGVIGIAAGFILPTILTDEFAPVTYINNALIFILIGVFAIALLLPGVKEDKIMIERYIIDRSEKTKDESFFKELFGAFHERNFLAWIIIYMFYQSAVVSITASVEYLGTFVIKTTTTLIFVGFLGGALIAIVFWLYLAKIIGSNQRTMMITATIMGIFSLPMLIVSDLYGFTIIAFLIGLGFGGYWMIMTPALSDVIDEIVIKTGRRNDGIFMGFRAFFGRFAFAIQAIAFAVVHELTGFINDPKAVQSELALFGIQIHTGLIPALFLFIGVIVFYFMNTLNTEKVSANKEKLREMNL